MSILGGGLLHVLLSFSQNVLRAQDSKKFQVSGGVFFFFALFSNEYKWKSSNNIRSVKFVVVFS